MAIGYSVLVMIAHSEFGTEQIPFKFLEFIFLISHTIYIKLFEKYAQGARPFALHIYAPERLILIAGVDEYCSIWQWTGFTLLFGIFLFILIQESIDDGKMISLNLLKLIDLCGGSLGTVRSILPVYSQNTGILKLVFFIVLIYSICSIIFLVIGFRLRCFG
jgi:hypothetical protein